MYNSYSPRSASQSVIMNLIMLNAVVFLAQILLDPAKGEWIVDTFGLHYWDSDKFAWWQPVTYMFLHGNWSHIFFNMFALWMFGRVMEYDLGPRRTFIYYMVCGVGAGLLTICVNGIEFASLAGQYGNAPQLTELINDTVTIGASGAVFGILLAFGLMHPNDRIMLLIPPIPMKAKYFVIIYGIIELLLGLSGKQAGVAHFAHVGGMLFGWLLLVIWKKQGKIYY